MALVHGNAVAAGSDEVTIEHDDGIAVALSSNTPSSLKVTIHKLAARCHFKSLIAKLKKIIQRKGSEQHRGSTAGISRKEAKAFWKSIQYFSKEQPILFEYRPLTQLNEIRVILLLPGLRAQTIACMVYYQLLEGVEYEALSYEWGQPSELDPFILVQGHRTRIRANLHDALVELRLEHRMRAIWIDQLSINQADIKERSQQVQMMSAIYSSAVAVIVWLGPAKDDSAYIMDALAQEYVIQVCGNFSTSQWGSLVALCYRTYWSRIWVQQEIHLAKRLTFHCGDRSVPRIPFINSIEVLRSSSPDENMNDALLSSPAYGVVARLQQAGTLPTSLTDWLTDVIMKDLKTTEPRDLIYGLLGISFDFHGDEIVPDYSKPLEEVYLQAIAFSASHVFVYRHPHLERRLAEKMGLEFDERLQGLVAELIPEPLAFSEPSLGEGEVDEEALAIRFEHHRTAQRFITGVMLMMSEDGEGVDFENFPLRWDGV